MNVLLGDAELRTNRRKGETSLTQLCDQVAQGQFGWSATFTLLGHTVVNLNRTDWEEAIIAAEQVYGLESQEGAPRNGTLPPA